MEWVTIYVYKTQNGESTFKVASPLIINGAFIYLVDFIIIHNNRHIIL